MKKKIIYASVISGAIIFNFLFIFSYPACADITPNSDCLSCHLADGLAAEEAVSAATVRPHLVCLFSISESPVIPFRVPVVPAGSRDPPITYIFRPII